MAFAPTPEQRQALAQMLFAGQKIAAIKEVRKLGGLDLKDSKEWVDGLEKELRAAQPEKFATPPRKVISCTPGCILALALILSLTAVALWILWHRK